MLLLRPAAGSVLWDSLLIALPARGTVLSLIYTQNCTHFTHSTMFTTTVKLCVNALNLAHINVAGICTLTDAD